MKLSQLSLRDLLWLVLAHTSAEGNRDAYNPDGDPAPST